MKLVPVRTARRHRRIRRGGLWRVWRNLLALLLIFVGVEVGHDMWVAWRTSRMGVPAEPGIEVSAFGIKSCASGLVGRLRSSCIVDGDTGWEKGVKWRLIDIDTPELVSPGCSAERVLAERARDRLIALMGQGYRIRWTGQEDRYGRKLVTVQLRGGRSASGVLVSEGLARRPGTPKSWC